MEEKQERLVCAVCGGKFWDTTGTNPSMCDFCTKLKATFDPKENNCWRCKRPIENFNWWHYTHFGRTHKSCREIKKTLNNNYER